MPRQSLASFPLLSASLLFVALTAGPALASWPHDPDVNVPLCTTTNHHQNLSSCTDGAGGAIVVWADARTGNYDIYVQRVDRDGNVLWTADGVDVCAAAGSQTNSVLCTDGQGGAFLVWTDSRTGTTDIYMQRIDASGTPQWTANGVAVCTATGTQGGPTLCADGTGGAIVAWWDVRAGGLADIYAQRVNSAGTAQWTANGLLLCSAAGTQDEPRLAPDGAGGTVVAWRDNRAGNYDVYACRVTTLGVVQWAGNGVAVCTEATAQSNMEMVTDGSGGAILAWTSGSEIYVQRMDYTGAAKWAANGMLVCTTASSKDNACIVSDSDGGAIVAWEDYRNGVDHNIYAQRVKGNGLLLWNAAGVTLCSATGDQNYPGIASDGAGGALVAWTDARASASLDDIYARRVNAAGMAQWGTNGVAVCTNRINVGEMAVVTDGRNGAVISWGGTHSGADGVFAQRADRFGEIGSPEPAVTAITDVDGDQGGQVAVEWSASYLDADPGYDIYSYSIWRQVPSSLALARAGSRRALRTTVEGAQTVYWECVGSQPARARAGYSFVAPTTTDSMPGANPLTRFMVSAEEYGGVPYWDSAPDSGYSVDDLAPPMPAPFTGEFAGASAHLQWGACPAPDFAAFQLHRGDSPDFVPGPGNLVATTTSGGCTDPAPALCYKLRAVDIHGNAGPYAALTLSSALDAPAPALAREAWLAAPAPNPARSGALLRFGLPRGGRVTLALFDLSGRRVRTLLTGTLTAGEHQVRWDGADEHGRAVAAGAYLCRLEAAERTLTRRLAVLR